MESILQFAILAILGLLGGVLAGVVGVGGGAIFIPGLVYIVGWGIKDAIAASLMITIFSSFSGTIRNAWSEDPIHWRVAALLASTVAQVAFAGLLLALSYPMARGSSSSSEGGRKMPLSLVLVAGIGIGVLAGLVGIGGGGMMVPLMVLGFGLSTKRAVSTSLAVTFCTSVMASIGYIATCFGDLLSLPPLIVGSVLGPLLGVRLREWLPEKAIRIGFAGLMVVVALRTLGSATGIL